MPISEKIQKAAFTKSVAGYAPKEVDAFLGDLLPLAMEQEQLLTSLRAKLGAMEARTEEIARLEKEAYRLLEKAREEAERIVAAAEDKARATRTEAEQTAETKVQTAEREAAELVASAEKKARTSIDTAKKTAETILNTADQKGKALLSEAAEYATAEREKARKLIAECTAFETKFRTIVSDTAHALAKLQAAAPAIPAAKSVETAPKPVPDPAPAAPAEKPAAPVAETHDTEEAPETRDFSFAGGRPMPSATQTAEKPRRKPYEAVSVTYENEDDFAGIRKLMEDAPAKPIKNPTHFSE